MRRLLAALALWRDVLAISAGNSVLQLFELQSRFLPLAPWQHHMSRQIIASTARIIERHQAGE